MCMACAPETAVDAEKAAQSADKRMVLEHGDNGVDRVAFDVQLLRGDHLALRIQHDAELPLRAGDRVDVVGVASAVHEVLVQNLLVLDSVDGHTIVSAPPEARDALRFTHRFELVLRNGCRLGEDLGGIPEVHDEDLLAVGVRRVR